MAEVITSDMPRLLRTAAIVKVASNKGAQKQAAADQQAQAAADQQAQAAQQAAAPVPETALPQAAPVDPTMAQMQNLANLHSQGILSDEEFAAAKAKLLGI